MSATPRESPRHRLENALLAIHGVVSLLVSTDCHDGLPAAAAHYLGNRLEEHYKDAEDAFSEIFGMDDYSKQPRD